MSLRKTVARLSAVLCLLTWPLYAVNGLTANTGVTGNNSQDDFEPFGAKLFTGNFLKARGDGFNLEYILTSGDKVAVAAWGAVTINQVFTLDSQGNIFIPEIGPLKLEGVKNADLTTTVKAHIRKVYTNNFDV